MILVCKPFIRAAALWIRCCHREALLSCTLRRVVPSPALRPGVRFIMSTLSKRFRYLEVVSRGVRLRVADARLVGAKEFLYNCKSDAHECCSLDVAVSRTRILSVSYNKRSYKIPACCALSSSDIFFLFSAPNFVQRSARVNQP